LPRWTAPPQRVVPGNLQCPKPITKSQRKLNYSLNLSACVEPEKILVFYVLHAKHRLNNITYRREVNIKRITHESD